MRKMREATSADWPFPARIVMLPEDTACGFMALVALDGNGTTLLTAEEARTLARRLDDAARELER